MEEHPDGNVRYPGPLWELSGDNIQGSFHPSSAAESKVYGLDEAIRRFVSPGMSLHLAGGIGGPSAAICAIIRQYYGQAPAFTVIQSTLSGHALNLVHCGLVEKLICAVCADISATARPSRIVQRALADRKISLENWSLYSLQQRLMAGAQGLPFTVTRSVVGSSIAADNAESFKEMKDPFGSGETVGAVKSLNPDISIVHGCVADGLGNIVMAEPLGEDLWGSLASTGGVLATVERLVPAEFIKEYAALVKIPGHMVKAVCVAPMGLHPFSLPNPGIRDFTPYDKDVPFLNDLHEASKSPETLDAWIQRWIVEVPSHEDYLEKLGHERTAALTADAGHKGKAPSFIPSARPAAQEECTAEELVLVALMREIVGAFQRSGLKTILSGAGSRGVAAFAAYYRLKQEGFEVDLVTGNGQVGFTPLPGLSILSTEVGVRTCTMLTDTILAQGVIVGGRNNACLSVLGAGQIDRYGNINSTVTAAGQFLVGSGGANDAMNARVVIVALDQSKDRFVETLPYVTGRGDRVMTVVSSMGVFKRLEPASELELVMCLPGEPQKDIGERVRAIQENCGWSLRVGAQVQEMARPEQAEIELLRWLLSAPSADQGRSDLPSDGE